LDFLSLKYIIWATTLGALSAVSLPLGSLVALRTNPRPQYISILAAFGAGALIAALSVELVAPTVFALHEETGTPHQGDPLIHFFVLLIGAVLGSILFVVLDQLVNEHGGFLRKTTTSMTFFKAAERNRQRKLLEKLSQWPLLQNVSAEHVNTLVSMVRPMDFHDGEIIARQGKDAKALFFVMEGSVSVTRDGSGLGELGQNNLIGVVPILTQIPNPGTATAKGRVAALALSQEDFDRLRKLSPAFDQACGDLTRERLELLEKLVTERHEQAVKWAREATHALNTGTQIPSTDQLRRAKEEHGGAPLAIWLGILLDGIPESFVIGSGLLVLMHAKAELIGALRFIDVIPFTLIQYEVPGLAQEEYLSDVVFPYGDHRYWRWCGLFGCRCVDSYLVDLCRRAGCRRNANHDCFRHDP